MKSPTPMIFSSTRIPHCFLEVPKTGVYHLSIRDSIYRGREDFVYRIAVGEIPFVTGIFPLGSQLGTDPPVTAYGWNLKDAPEFALNTSDVWWFRTREGSFVPKVCISNYVHYGVGQLPEFVEKESNDSMEAAQIIDLQIDHEWPYRQAR